MVPFLRQVASKAFQKGFGFVPEESISGAYEGGEVSPLGQAVLQVFLLLVPLGVFEDLLVGARRVALPICVDNLDVDYTVRPSLPESSDADVAAVSVGKDGVGWVGVWVWCGFWHGIGRWTWGAGGVGAC